MKLITTTKLLLIFNDTVSLIISIVAVNAVLDGISSATDIVTIATAWIALAATFHGFYAWKSKNENRQKIAAGTVKSFARTYGIEAALRLAEIILKD